MSNMGQNTVDKSKIEEINKIYNYANKLILEENKTKEEVVAVLVEMGVSEQKASSVCSDIIYQVSLDKERDETAPKKTVKGWLTFFLISVCVGAIISLGLGFTQFSLSDYDGYGNISKYLGAFSEIYFYIFLGILGVYVTISFVNINPNAVFLGKAYLIVLFLNNLIVLLIGSYANSHVGSFSQLSRSLVFCGVWFCYLSFSKQVNDLFPSKKRIVYSRDIILISSVVIVFMLFFLAVLIESF